MLNYCCMLSYRCPQGALRLSRSTLTLKFSIKFPAHEVAPSDDVTSLFLFSSNDFYETLHWWFFFTSSRSKKQS